MVTACLLHNHPNPPGKRTHVSSAWQVPEVSIERLLELSSTIPLVDGEVTPVQAWDQVRRHAQFSGLEVERLNMLKEKLVTHVKCYG